MKDSLVLFSDSSKIIQNDLDQFLVLEEMFLIFADLYLFQMGIYFFIDLSILGVVLVQTLIKGQNHYSIISIYTDILLIIPASNS